MNTEHCAQSVRNVRVCCLVVRTRVCQMFPFTSYNPLGHPQSQRMFSLSSLGEAKLGQNWSKLVKIGQNWSKKI